MLDALRLNTSKHVFTQSYIFLRILSIPIQVKLSRIAYKRRKSNFQLTPIDSKKHNGKKTNCLIGS